MRMPTARRVETQTGKLSWHRGSEGDLYHSHPLLHLFLSWNRSMQHPHYYWKFWLIHFKDFFWKWPAMYTLLGLPSEWAGTCSFPEGLDSDPPFSSIFGQNILVTLRDLNLEAVPSTQMWMDALFLRPTGPRMCWLIYFFVILTSVFWFLFVCLFLFLSEFCCFQ